MLELLSFRCWDLLVEPPVIFKQVVVVNNYRHLRRLILRKCLPLKLSCFARLLKGSNFSSSSSKMSTIPINLKLQGIGISWKLSPLSST